MLGLFAFLLWHTAPDDLRLARQIFRCSRNAGRHRQAPVHHRRNDGLRPDDSARPDLDQVVDPKIGGKRWQALHRLIYFSAAAGVIHYIWLVKADLKKPLEYAAVLGVLMLYRVIVWIGSRSPAGRECQRLGRVSSAGVPPAPRPTLCRRYVSFQSLSHPSSQPSRRTADKS